MTAYGGDSQNSWGFSHLSGHPITLTFGSVLLGALIILIVIRFAFSSVDIIGGVR